MGEVDLFGYQVRVWLGTLTAPNQPNYSLVISRRNQSMISMASAFAATPVRPFMAYGVNCKPST